jgi:hypothetical protein
VLPTREVRGKDAQGVVRVLDPVVESGGEETEPVVVEDREKTSRSPTMTRITPAATRIHSIARLKD